MSPLIPILHTKDIAAAAITAVEDSLMESAPLQPSLDLEKVKTSKKTQTNQTLNIQHMLCFLLGPNGTLE